MTVENNSKSKVVLITGGSRGIGLALVKTFKAAGWKVAACSRQPINKNLDMKNMSDLSFSCDVANKVSVIEGIDLVIKRFGRLDAIINNAGIAGSNTLELEDDDKLWHDIIDVNLHGTYYITKYALPHLPNETGRIINIASVLALIGVPDQTAYTAAKHAVLGFTRAVAALAASRQITVNAICPGWVRTDMAMGRWKEMNLTESEIIKTIPLGRIIEPEEVAELALFLASPSAKNITAQALTIDGGALM